MNITRKQRRLAIAVLALVACAPGIAAGDAVSDWNIIMQTTVSGQPPFPQARFAAITQLAVFEAVNAITGDYKPYPGDSSRCARRIRGGCGNRRCASHPGNLFPHRRGDT